MAHERFNAGRVVEIGRRGALTAIGAGAAGFVVFGPRPGGARRTNRITIDYWEKWTGHEALAMRRVVDRFNEMQSRVEVRYFSMSNIDKKAMIAIAGGAPPDIIGMGNFSIPAYAESAALLPLDELADEFGIRPEQYAPAIWKMLTHAGKLWGVVNTCGALALFYNRESFRDAGLDPDVPPRTIEELDEANRRIMRRDRQGKVDRVGFLHTEPTWWSWFWGYYFGGNLYDESRDLATAAAPENIRAYEWVQRYPRDIGVEKLISFQETFGFYGTPEHPFLKNKVAMTNQGPWLANIIAEYRPDMDYGIAPFPVLGALYEPDRPIGLLDCDVLVIPRGAPHPREAFEFIAFTQRPEIVEFLSTAHCKNSPLVTSSDPFVSEHPNRFVEVHNAIARSPRAFVFPRTRTWPEYVAAFNAGMQRMWRLEDDAEPILRGIERVAQEQLDRAADRRRRRADLAPAPRAGSAS